jgi:hypothetical protein
MESKRFAIATSLAFALVVVLAIAGAELAWPIVRWRLERVLPGARKLVFGAPDEPLMIYVRYAAAFALAPLVAWYAVVIRFVREAPLRPGVVAGYFAIALAGLAIAIVLPTLLMPSFEAGSLEPMIRASELAPGPTEEALGMLFALALWALAWIGSHARVAPRVTDSPAR